MSEDYNVWDSLGKAFDDSTKRISQRIEQLKGDPCMDLANVGDHVVIDACAVGKGRPECPLEAEVLIVAGTTYKVRYCEYKNYKCDELRVEWIQSYVVLAVVKGAVTNGSQNQT